MGQARRIELHNLLRQCMGNAHNDNVYFQPPENIELSFPCIIYARDNVATSHADNQPYKRQTRYAITVVDADPDSDIPDNVGALPTSAFNRAFVADGLHHDVYTVYF